MSAPNDFGSNRTKAIIIMPIAPTGEPVSDDNPQPIELIYNGEPVSVSNPLPVVSV